MKNQKILVIAAHPDDEILGCGATLSKYKRLGAEVMVCILSDGESSRARPNLVDRRKSLEQVCHFLQIDHLRVFNFPDSQFDTVPLINIIKKLEEIKTDFNPHFIFTHGNYDLNIDHQITYQASLTAFRPLPNAHLTHLLTYEVLSTTDAGQSIARKVFIPNYFEEVDDIDVQNKLKAMSFYQSELHKAPHPRSLRSIEAQLILRGSSIGVMNAEAFYLEKFISRLAR